MEFGYCKYVLRDALCRMDTSIKLKRELFTDTKGVKFGKFKDFKSRNRTNPDLLYPAPNLLTNNAIAGQNMRFGKKLDRICTDNARQISSRPSCLHL